jgi:hypothetical protein
VVENQVAGADYHDHLKLEGFGAGCFVRNLQAMANFSNCKKNRIFQI